MAIARSTVGDGDSICEKIIECVASAEGVGPTEVTPPLYDAVDPDALERLFSSRRSTSLEGTLAFDYSGHDVRVFTGEEVVVEVDGERE